MIYFNNLDGLDVVKLGSVWHSMISRCRDESNKSYANYGGRGIDVWDGWEVFDSFLEWANESGYRRGLSIDRIDNSKGYFPWNCRWATRQEQVMNRRNTIIITCWGESKFASEWLQDIRVQPLTMGTLLYRIRSGWDHEKALTTPVRRTNAQ